MSASQTTATVHDEHSPIENYTEAIHALVQHEWLQPDGTRQRVEVDDPRVLDSRDPEYLRVSVPRKGLTFKIIEDAEAFGLKVADVWQHDQDKANDRVMLKLEPEEETA